MSTAELQGISNSHKVALVLYIEDLSKQQDRAGLAALRTGLGKAPGTAPRMFPLIARFLPSDKPGIHASFLTASLMASHPDTQEVGSLGASLHLSIARSEGLTNGKHNEAGVEARLVAMLDAHRDDLPKHLEGLVILCSSAGTPIDWSRFYWDIRILLGDDEEKIINTKLRWAREFWQGPRAQSKETSLAKEAN